MVLIDAHCHLEGKDFPLPGEVLARAKAAGLVHAVVVGLLQKSGDFGNAIEVAAAHPAFLTPTIGIHPHDAAQAAESDWETLARLTGADGTPEYAAERPGDIQRTWLDSAHARALWGWSARVSLEDGMARTVEWFRTHSTP